MTQENFGEARLHLVRSTGFTLEADIGIPQKGITVLFGPSGCGKTTLLRCVAGLERARGLVRIGSEIWQDDERKIFRPTYERSLGYVFQEASLFAHLSVEKNLTFGLERTKVPDGKERLAEAVELLGIGHLLTRRVTELSGGERQRCAIARALCLRPEILLMDEPFGALDPVTRGALQQEMTRIHRLLGRTIVLVTHDIDEALRLAEHLVLMDHGEVVQQGNPLTMLTRPANDFVRQFFGHSELGVRLLSLRSVADYVRREERAEGEALAEEMTLRDALSLFVARGCEVLPVVNTQGEPCGTLHFQDLLEEA
jgi:ABC-type proline/glycine betaine transport system ATPase subunit